jgi:hypothetical protein
LGRYIVDGTSILEGKRYKEAPGIGSSPIIIIHDNHFSTLSNNTHSIIYTPKSFIKRNSFTIPTMQLKTLLSHLALAALSTHASAECQLSNSVGDKAGTIETNDKLCKPQGEGDWTMSFSVTQIGFPTFSGGNAFAGLSGQKGWAIYDNTCALKGVYGPSGNQCDTPFVIEENFLTQVLSITGFTALVGQASFGFKYGDGYYVTKNNHCGCVNDPDGLRGQSFCKCAFPVDGHFKGDNKRAIEFEA